MNRASKCHVYERSAKKGALSCPVAAGHPFSYNPVPVMSWNTWELVKTGVI